MPLSGDLQAIRGLSKKLEKLQTAPQAIARALSPRIAPLVTETFAAQAGPSGGAWPPTKSGAPAFVGSDASMRVLSRLTGKASVRTTVLFPLHFHQDGTHVVGRKRGRKIASKLTDSYVGAVLSQQGMKGSAPKRRKDESAEAFAHRLERYANVKATRSDARRAARGFAADAVAEARAAGGWHDPPRPMIPDEGDPIPGTWDAVIVKAARDVMATYGITEMRP